MYIQLKTWTTVRHSDGQDVITGDVHSFENKEYGIHLHKHEIIKLDSTSALSRIIDDCNHHRREKFEQAQVPKSLHSIWVNLDDLKLEKIEPRFVLSRYDPNREIKEKEKEQQQLMLQEYQKIEKYGEF